MPTPVTILLACLVPAAHLAAQSFTPVNELPGVPAGSQAFAIADDGSVAGGAPSMQSQQAFRWTGADGFAGFGDLPGGDYYSFAEGCSNDGSVAVGWGNDAQGARPFRWTEATGLVTIGPIPGGGPWGIAHGVSADGAVVVGYASTAAGTEAFRWTEETGMVALEGLGGGVYSEAHGISPDGTVIVGDTLGPDGMEAFRWTEGTGMVGLGHAPEFPVSSALAVSDGGEVIVGYVFNPDSHKTAGFYWTEADGIVVLPDWQTATDVSTDGAIIVGQMRVPGGGYEAAYWTPQQGSRSLWQDLVDAGVEEAALWWLQFVHAVSPDGTAFVGFGSSDEHGDSDWIARFPRPCYADFTGDGSLDLFDFLAFANLFNAYDPVADCDHDGAFTLFDFLCFTNAFNAGC